MTRYIAVLVDGEYNADEWWQELRENYPVFARSLQRDGHAIIAAHLWNYLEILPGFCDGPDYAKSALIDGGDDGDLFCHVAISRNSMFDELS